MKKILMMAAAATMLFSCQSDDATNSSFEMKASGADYAAACSKPVVPVSGPTGTVTWTSGNVYEIDGVVTVQSGDTLTIEPGTFIKAVPHAEDEAEGVLVVSRGGYIDAQGTAEAPIIFTSYNLLDCNSGNTPAPGDFGGVVLLGKAEVNTGTTTNVIEGLGDQSPLSDYQYGGTVNNDNSGIMKYVRIEYAGRILDAATGVEINGLTFGGVGNGTSIDYIQVSYGKDDSFEFFGGAVNANHLVSFACDDDNFDFDLGYTGTITRALAIADRNGSHSQSGGNPDSNGIELDNNAGGTITGTITHPVISYMSIFGLPGTSGDCAADGNLLENGIHIRRVGGITMTNSTVSGYNRGVYIESGTSSTPPNCVFANVASDAFTTAEDPALASITGTVSCPALSFGTSQPWFNNGTLNFSTAARTNGAFAGGGTPWTNTWTKFSGF